MNAKKFYTVKYQFLSSKCNNIKTTSTKATKLEPPTHSFYVVGLDEIYLLDLFYLCPKIFSITDFFKHVPANTIIYLFLNWNGNLVSCLYFSLLSSLDPHYGQTEAPV